MACTSFMRSWQDFEFVQLAILPMFLFSTTFFPLSVYPRPLQLVVQVTPLYQGIELVRPLTTGAGVGTRPDRARALLRRARRARIWRSRHAGSRSCC